MNEVKIPQIPLSTDTNLYAIMSSGAIAMNIELTKDSDYLICALYKDYLKKRESGVSKYDAKKAGSSQTIQENIFPNWSLDDVVETCRELSRAGLLWCEYSGNQVYTSCLSDLGIVYMEKHFENKINAIIEYMSKIKSMTPFI
jgi:hypothetical protein